MQGYTQAQALLLIREEEESLAREQQREALNEKKNEIQKQIKELDIQYSAVSSQASQNSRTLSNSRNKQERDRLSATNRILFSQLEAFNKQRTDLLGKIAEIDKQILPLDAVTQVSTVAPEFKQEIVKPSQEILIVAPIAAPAPAPPPPPKKITPYAAPTVPIRIRGEGLGTNPLTEAQKQSMAQAASQKAALDAIRNYEKTHPRLNKADPAYIALQRAFQAAGGRLR